MKSCLVECLDIDHKLHPQTRRASKLDHVSIAAVKGLDGTQKAHAAFILELCALSNLSAVYMLSRIRFTGEPDKSQISLDSDDKIKALGHFGDSCLAAFRTDDQTRLVGFLAKYWRCYGGSWVIAVECQDEDAFLTLCRDADARRITPSEARDRIVLISRTASVSFDDSILDLVTKACNADALRTWVQRTAIRNKVDVNLCPLRYANTQAGSPTPLAAAVRTAEDD